MTRTTRPFRAAAALLALAAVLTGCTARPAAAPAAGTTAEPAASVLFACPSPEEVAALTAVPFTGGRSGATRCDYTADADGSGSTTVRVTHPGTGAATSATPRVAAITRGDTTADLPSLGFDAFSAASKQDCTVWFPAVDGALTSVTARRSGEDGAAVCDLATAVATLAGAGTPGGSAPTVAVLASDRLLGTRTVDAAWPWRIGTELGARIDRLTGSGYLHPSRSGSLARAAADVPADAAAVVFVSGTAEAGASRLEVLSATTAALSAAAARAPRARLVVVGPVAAPTTDPAGVEDLRVELRAAAGIAGAEYVEPEVAAGSTSALRSTADAISATLSSAGIGAG